MDLVAVFTLKHRPEYGYLLSCRRGKRRSNLATRATPHCPQNKQRCYGSRRQIFWLIYNTFLEYLISNDILKKINVVKTM